jgi:HK97 gp10 family phage protein
MTKVRVKFSGLNELRVTIKKSMNLSDVKNVVSKNGAELSEKMQRKTTSAFTKGYSQGNTARSIKPLVVDNGMTVEVEPKMNYDPYVEYGTRFMEAEPFVNPAFEKQAPVFIKDIEDLIK